MLKLLIATVVLFHGVGHILFLAPTIRLASWGQTGHSWVMTPVLGDGIARILGAGLWTAAIVLFVAAFGGLVMSAEWWRAVAIGGALVSLGGIVLMWDGIAPSNAFFALAFDLVVLVALLWARWPSAELVGS